MREGDFHVRLDDELNARLDLLAKGGGSKSSIVRDAVRAYIDRGAAIDANPMIVARLDKLSQQIGRLDRDSQVLIETLGLFVRYQLNVTPPLPVKDQAAARAQGQARFDNFIEQVGQRLKQRRGFADAVYRQTDGATGAPAEAPIPEAAE